MSQRCGGLSDSKNPSEEERAMVNKLRPDIESHISTDKTSADTDFIPLSVKTQVVTGTNYFIKIRVGKDSYIHVRIFKPLPHENEAPSLAGVQEGKTLEDEIEYFQPTKTSH